MYVVHSYVLKYICINEDNTIIARIQNNLYALEDTSCIKRSDNDDWEQ